jgi:hypothetical protein
VQGSSKQSRIGHPGKLVPALKYKEDSQCDPHDEQCDSLPGVFLHSLFLVRQGVDVKREPGPGSNDFRGYLIGH